MSAEEVRRSIAETAPSLFECSPAPQGGVRVRTPLVYPDGPAGFHAGGGAGN